MCEFKGWFWNKDYCWWSLCFSWAIILQWKVCFTVNLILSSSSRSMAISARIFSRVWSSFFKYNKDNFFFQSDSSLIDDNFILNSCKTSWQSNPWAGKFVWFCIFMGFYIQVDGFRYYWITIGGIFCLFQTRSASKAAGMFSGTQEKCATCGKTAYPLEKVRFKNLESKLVYDICYGVRHIFVTYWIYKHSDHKNKYC